MRLFDQKAWKSSMTDTSSITHILGLSTSSTIKQKIEPSRLTMQSNEQRAVQESSGGANI